MNQLTRRGLLFAAALILALTLGPIGRACATCGSVRHTVHSETTNRQTSTTQGGVTTDTQEVTVHSQVTGDQGDVWTEDSSTQKNADGSTHEHEQMHHEDPQGCYADGEPWTGDETHDVTTDPKGNRKEHDEQIIEKNGKCVKSVRDQEWNAKGEQIKDTGWVDTEIPCSRWNLEVRIETAVQVGPVTEGWGPGLATIPLAADGNTYKGSYEGVFDYWMTGPCSGTGTVPLTFDVTANKEKFGDNDELAFSVKASGRRIATVNCQGVVNSPDDPITLADTFTLPAEDGASWNDNSGSLVSFTYTLKKQGP
jgi:hypothetical protein